MEELARLAAANSPEGRTMSDADLAMRRTMSDLDMVKLLDDIRGQRGR